jgi:hypothetical protein
MGKRFRFSSQRKRGRTWSREGTPGRLLLLGLATLLLFLSAVVHVTHTCSSHRLLPPGPLAQGLTGNGRSADVRQDPADSPCLACLFLHALSATQISLLNFDLSGLSTFQYVPPHQPSLLARDAACLYPIRAPPQSAFPS